MSFDHNDPILKRYLDDIRNTKPINRQQEQELFRLCAEGSRSARAYLIQANMRFVLKVALQYRGCPLPLPDLINEGSMGLIRAIESFDPTRGLKFISYAVWWIKAYITRAINDSGSMIRLPANQHLRVRKALKEKAKGIEIEQEIEELIQLGEQGVSFDRPLSDDTRTTYSEVLADETSRGPEAETEALGVEEMMRTMVRSLPEREAQVLQGIYGINQDSAQTLREVGDALNISHERVRQLRDQALKRIRRQTTKTVLREKFEGYLEAVSN